jgi:CBS domain containing-hemolysin-like protein
MAAAQRRSGITARDLLRHHKEGGPGERVAIELPGPIPSSTSLEEIVQLLRSAGVEGIDVLDEQGRLEGTITREDAIRVLSRNIEEMAEERRVLQLALERQRLALDDTASRLGQIRETLDLADELRRGSSEAAPALLHALAEIRRILGESGRR